MAHTQVSSQIILWQKCSSTWTWKTLFDVCLVVATTNGADPRSHQAFLRFWRVVHGMSEIWCQPRFDKHQVLTLKQPCIIELF